MKTDLADRNLADVPLMHEKSIECSGYVVEALEFQLYIISQIDDTQPSQK
jgi:hypothetical protein